MFTQRENYEGLLANTEDNLTKVQITKCIEMASLNWQNRKERPNRSKTTYI